MALGNGREELHSSARSIKETHLPASVCELLLHKVYALVPGMFLSISSSPVANVSKQMQITLVSKSFCSKHHYMLCKYAVQLLNLQGGVQTTSAEPSNLFYRGQPWTVITPMLFFFFTQSCKTAAYCDTLFIKCTDACL